MFASALVGLGDRSLEGFLLVLGGGTRCFSSLCYSDYGLGICHLCAHELRIIFFKDDRVAERKWENVDGRCPPVKMEEEGKAICASLDGLEMQRDCLSQGKRGSSYTQMT